MDTEPHSILSTTRLMGRVSADPWHVTLSCDAACLDDVKGRAVGESGT